MIPLKKKRSKAWDVRYHWLSDQSALNKFLFIGIREPTIMLITTQNITVLRIILIHGRNISQKGFHVYTIEFTHNVYPLYSPFSPKAAPTMVKI